MSEEEGEERRSGCEEWLRGVAGAEEMCCYSPDDTLVPTLWRSETAIICLQAALSNVVAQETSLAEARGTEHRGGERVSLPTAALATSSHMEVPLALVIVSPGKPSSSEEN
ncbi:unnamed protein product [Arctogadus glacialis]